MNDPVGWPRQVALVGSLTARDLLRRRATWTTMLLGGLVVAALVVGTGMIAENIRSRAEAITYRIVIDGDVEGGSEFIDRLETDAMAIDLVADAEQEVTEQLAAAGLRLPPDLDTRMANREELEIVLFHRARNDNSRAALHELLLGLQELQAEELAAEAVDLGIELPGTTVVTEHEVTLDPRVNRRALGSTLAALATLLCLGVITSASSAVATGRDDRSIESTLMLPLSRSALSAGFVAGAIPVAVTQLLVVVGIIVATSAAPLPGLSQPAATVLSMLGVALPAALLLGVLASATGVLAGVFGAGSDDAVTLGDLMAVPFVGVAAAFFLAPELLVGPVAWMAPIVGPAAMLRDGVGGDLGGAQVGLTIVSSLIWTVLLVLAATVRVGDERRILRLN